MSIRFIRAGGDSARSWLGKENKTKTTACGKISQIFQRTCKAKPASRNGKNNIDSNDDADTMMTLLTTTTTMLITTNLVTTSIVVQVALLLVKPKASRVD